MNQSALFSNLRKLISVVDTLRDVGLQQYINLPKVVVVGTQSAGKSSLLQQIVGLDFLPRGSGVVTRRPLQMRLVYVHDLKEPYATFDEIPTKKFGDFKIVKKTIEQLTDKICGTKKNIVDKPIIMYVYSSSCPNLTLVDLPGLTKVPIDGQDINIGEITEKMTRKYIQDQKTIILCVIAANQDLSTSEALSLAQKIDVKGERTIGCLTKIDIMDRGTSARAVLLNEQINLTLGYVGIKNRSQQDIIDNKSVLESLKDQKKYFATNPAYSSLPQGTTGTQSLTTKLSTQLYKQIKKFMPEVIEQITKRLSQLEKKIKIYGPALPTTQTQKIQVVWKMTNSFLQIYKGALEGSYNSNFQLDKQLMATGASIRQSLAQLYKSRFVKQPTRKLTDKDINNAIIQFEGESIPGFPSIDSFLFLLVPLIQKLKKPALKCLNQVNQKLQDLAIKAIDIAMPRYQIFRQQFKEHVLSIFAACRKQALVSITDIIDSEKNYIHTNDNQYLNQVESNNKININQKMSKEAQKNPLIIILRRRIDCYYKIVVRNLRDIVAKQIFMYTMKHAQTNLQFGAFQMLNRSDKLDKWLTEPGNIRTQREMIQKQYQTLKKAEKCIKVDNSLYEMYSASKMKHIKKLEQLQKQEKEVKILKQKQQKKPAQKKNSPNDNINQILGLKKPGDNPNSNNNPGGAGQNNSNQSLNNNQNTRPNLGILPDKKPQVMKNIFGIQIKKDKGLTDNYNENMGKATDKGVDQLYKNEQFKQQSKNAVEKGTAMAVQQKLGPGNQAIANTAGKGMGYLFGMDSTQNYLKQKTKEAARDQTQIKK